MGSGSETRTVPGAGASIGPYRLVEPLGRGGAALVFRAVDERTQRIVALKTVRAASEGLLASVRREIQALERIRHPGVVEILDGGVSEGWPWYAMELVDGATLWNRLSGNLAFPLSQTTELPPGFPGRVTAETVTPQTPGPAPAPAPGPAPTPSAPPPAPGVGVLRRRAVGGELPWFLTLIRRLCEPLAYIHGEGIIHRDLTPSNVFVRGSGMPVLMDFGLVWRHQEATETSREVIAVEAARGGTIAYMAPEQARGDRMDARGDLFSLGCIMYEAITGLLPYPARSLRELMIAHADRPPPVPSHLVDGVPPALDALVMGLLQQRPRDRIGHARDVASGLADLGAEGWPGGESPHANAYLYRPQLVGRGAPLDQALGQVAALDRAGGCVFVGGVSGIGKTSFVSEVARLAALQGIRVVTGECLAMGVAEGRELRRGGPLSPFRRLLQAVADRCVAGGLGATLRMLGERAKVLAAVEPSLRHLPGAAETPEPADVPGEAARRRLIDALAETLSAFVAEQPTLLVLDDLQWADDLTLAFLASLSMRYYATNRVLIVGTFRSEELGAELERVTAVATVAALHLDRLDATAIGAMAADMLGQRQVPDRLAAFLTAESSGNPFFVAEVLRAAVDAGLLFRDDRGRWQQTDGGVALDGVGLPRTLQALVTRRLETLPAEARRAAEVASVLGREVEIDTLAAVAIAVGAAPDEAGFDESLRLLLVRQVLEPASPGSVRFVHDKLREIAYEALPPERQRTLHASSAKLLEERHAAAGTLGRAYAVLAHHFEKAGETGKAIAYFDKAGEAADAMHANQEAVRLLEKARALEEQVARGSGAGAAPTTATAAATAAARARRARLLGLNASALGDVTRAIASLTEAAAIGGRPWPRSKLRLGGRVLLALGREIARRWLPGGRRRARTGAIAGERRADREGLLEAARAYERLMVLNFWVTGDMAAVALSAVANMDLAELAGGISGERALGYATFSAMCAFIPLDGVSRSYARRAVEMARQSGDQVASTWVLMNVSVIHLHAGRWSEVRALLEEVRTLARGIGFARRWEESTTELSTASFLAGRFEEAARINDELVSGIERADPQTKCWAVVRQAELALMRGDAAEALDAGERGARLCEQGGLGRAEWIYALGALALARLRAGDPGSARAAADSCGAWISKGSLPIFYNIFAYAARVEVYLALHQAAGPAAGAGAAARAELAAAARRAVRQLRAIARVMPVAQPRALLARGFEALRLDGRPERAARYFRASLERAQGLQMPYDQAMALAALGEHGRQGLDEAHQRLREAAELLRGTGARHDIERVERLRTGTTAS